MDVTKQLLDKVDINLSSSHYNEIRRLFQDEHNLEVVPNICGELLQQIWKHISQKGCEEDLERFECCVDVAKIISAKVSPEIILLEILELVEEAEDDVQFLEATELLGPVLLRVENKRLMALEWCLNSAQLYLEKIPVPRDHHLEDKDRAFLDSAEEYTRLTPILTTIFKLFKPFIKEATSGKNISLRHLLIYNLMSILGHVCCYLHFDQNNQPSPLQVTCNQMVTSIVNLNPDPFLYLYYLNNNSGSERYTDEDDLHSVGAGDAAPVQDRNTWKLHNKTSKLALGSFYFILFLQHKEQLLYVYDNKYLFFKICETVIPLFLKNHSLSTYKGLILLRHIVDVQNGFTQRDLSFPILEELLSKLNDIMIFSQVQENRQLALSLYKKIILLFDVKGRYYILLNLRKCVSHSGTLGYLITLLKEILIEAWNDPTYFTGKCLYDLIHIYCELSNSRKTDLVADADQIISALNFYRFFLIRNKGNQILHYIKKDVDIFISDLKEAIILSRAHYQLALHEPDKFEKPNIDVSVSGSVLPDISQTDRIHSINLSLNCIDLMDSLLSNLTDSIKLI